MNESMYIYAFMHIGMHNKVNDSMRINISTRAIDISSGHSCPFHQMDLQRPSEGETRSSTPRGATLPPLPTARRPSKVEGGYHHHFHLHRHWNLIVITIVMYVFMYVCMYVCIHVFMSVCTNGGIFLGLKCIDVWYGMYVLIYVWFDLFIYIARMYVCMYVCMYCMYVGIHARIVN